MNFLKGFMTFIIIKILFELLEYIFPDDSFPIIYYIIIGAGILYFLILGIRSLYGKGKHLFAFYNNMPKDEFEKYYDKKAVFRYEGIISIICSLACMALFIGTYANNLIALIIGYAVFILAIFIGAIYAKKTKRFSK